jgi:uncharacterized protein (TIGR02266 family)
MFMKDFLRDLPGGGLFVETTEPFEIGEEVDLVLVFPEIPEGLQLTGLVAWRRQPARWRSSLAPGIGVSFGDSNRSRVDFLLDYCRGQLSAARKPGRRIPVDLRVDIVDESGPISGRVKDISRGGVFIVTDRHFNPDTVIELDLYLDQGGDPERYSGRVAWHRSSGGDSGMGIELQFRAPIRRRRISRFVSRIESLIAQGKIPVVS